VQGSIFAGFFGAEEGHRRDIGNETVATQIQGGQRRERAHLRGQNAHLVARHGELLEVHQVANCGRDLTDLVGAQVQNLHQ